MFSLNKEIVKNQIADSKVIYRRGKNIFKLGNYYLKEADLEKQSFKYIIDGNYGDYEVRVNFSNDSINHLCTCPYYSDGCKHTVAVCLDIIRYVERYKDEKEKRESPKSIPDNELMNYDEIKAEALRDRQKRARRERFEITLGDTYKGAHIIKNEKGKEYVVTMHDPINEKGHCTCPDFNSNKLCTCKHIMHLHHHINAKKEAKSRIEKENFPFVHIYWNSIEEKPRCFYEKELPDNVRDEIERLFDHDGTYCKDSILDAYDTLERLKEKKSIRIDKHLLMKIDEALFKKEVENYANETDIDFSVVNATLYPYQKNGVLFALFRKSTLIADEMGLGKTLQAITISLLKKKIFAIEKVLIICPASLKEQWKLEIERFSTEDVTVIAGNKETRQGIYESNRDFFKITNYEAVLRDSMAISRFNPDLIILDEAQRIKNYETKTAQSIKSIPHRQSIVMTGTPLENKLEDLYSVIQFANPGMFTPLWEFAADHFIIKKDKKNRIFGYRNLDVIHQKLKTLVIRRKKEEVLDDLPDQVSNDYYVQLTPEQMEIHQGCLRSLLPLLNKKFLTPIDVRRIMELMTAMRMVCNSTFLIDRKTNLSPKLKELQSIITDLAIENRRKVVIFTEWTTMTFLIGKVLSELNIPFVEFTGKIPVQKRQALIKEFNENPDCKVFLSTDAGGVGLNLQTADCVINFELPWNPAKLNQRIGRVMRIGQKSGCINVINLIAKQSIEEKIMAGIQMKQELFDGVFDGKTDSVEFSREKKTELVNNIRAMLGDEPEIQAKVSADIDELSESTPHFLNPKALGNEEINISGEEESDIQSDEGENNDIFNADIIDNDKRKDDAKPQPENTPEKMEEVLENGMKFLNGLMSMSTGKPLIPDGQEKSISVDRKTGEVTMKFKLPGF